MREGEPARSDFAVSSCTFRLGKFDYHLGAGETVEELLRLSAEEEIPLGFGRARSGMPESCDAP
jgi:hypothetical protein